MYFNQFEGEYLLPAFKHIDFLWLIRGNIINEYDVVQLQTKLKAVESIQLVAELTHEKIKHKSNLIF